jgi:hypothetical protein
MGNRMADAIKPTASGADQVNDAAAADGQSINVRALRFFHKDGDMRGEVAKPGDEFPVARHRAAQLRANGLIEYVNDSDDKAIHGEIASKTISDRVKAQAENTKLPENSKGTPPRNPEVKLADVKDSKSSK